MSAPVVSILIANYNTTPFLKQGLVILFSNGPDPFFEVIVADNNSKDNIEEIAILFPTVKLIRNDKNEGFAYAQNQAFRLARGKYVIAFNPDAEITKGQLHKIADYFDANPLVGLLAPLTEETNGVVSAPSSTLPLFAKPQLLRLLQRNSEPKIPDKPYFVDWVWGTGLVARRDLFKDSLFEETSFLFWEEYWLALHVREQGAKIVIHPGIKIIHHTSVSFKFNPVKLTTARNLSAAHGYCVRKRQYGLVAAKANSVISFLDNLILYGFLKLKSLLSADNSKRNLMLANYKAEYIGNLKILFSGERYAREMEKKARETFL